MKGYIIITPTASGSVRISTIHESIHCTHLRRTDTQGVRLEIETEELPPTLVNLMTTCRDCGAEPVKAVRDYIQRVV